MTVIGLKGTAQIRQTRWNDLLEAKKSYFKFKGSSDKQEQRIAVIDRDFYNRYLSKYIA